MRRLQGRISFITGVAQAVVVEGDRLAQTMRTHRVPGISFFVNIVPQVGNYIEVLPRHVLVGRVVPHFILLAGREGTTESIDHLPGHRRRAQTAHRTRFAARHEAIPIPTMRRETSHFHVHTVGPGRVGDRLARGHQALKPFVLRHLPCDPNRFGRQPPPSWGRGASRVQITVPSGVGSPEATPNEKG